MELTTQPEGAVGGDEPIVAAEPTIEDRLAAAMEAPEEEPVKGSRKKRRKIRPSRRPHRSRRKRRKRLPSGRAMPRNRSSGA